MTGMNNNKALEVEIGCGKGKFLVARAEENPHIHFLGIDKAGKWMKRGARRSERKGLNNLVFLKGDVREILNKELKLQSVSVFHIYFPDPWPKRRHRRRRLLSEDFFKKLHTLLKPEGLIEIATDDEDYFSDIKKVVEKTEIAWGKISETVNQRPFPAILRTNYEIKYEAQGKPLYYLEFQK